jgi:hypothetical protein
MWSRLIVILGLVVVALSLARCATASIPPIYTKD